MDAWMARGRESRIDAWLSFKSLRCQYSNTALERGMDHGYDSSSNNQRKEEAASLKYCCEESPVTSREAHSKMSVKEILFHFPGN